MCLIFCFLILTSVIVKEDDDAILPCSLSTNENIESMVFDWKKEETVQVFMYNKGNHHNNGLTDQNEQFKSRVSHFPEELKHGNASIRIKETKREDKGNYTCFFPNRSKTFKVELVVGAAPKPYVKLLKEKGLLECEVPGAYPKPTVEWQDSDNKTLFSKTLQDIEDKNRFYITIQTSVTKPGCYRCVATQMAKWHQIPSETCVPDGSLSCWKVNLRPSLKSFADSKRFSSKIALYLAPSIFPSTLTSFPVPAEEKHPQSMMLPPPYLTVGMTGGLFRVGPASRPMAAVIDSSDPDLDKPEVDAEHTLFACLLFLRKIYPRLQKQDLALLQCVAVNQTILLQILQEENSATKLHERDEDGWRTVSERGSTELYEGGSEDRKEDEEQKEMMMDRLTEEVRQESLWILMFADDTVICSESREQVEESPERWRCVLERRGMEVSRRSRGALEPIPAVIGREAGYTMDRSPNLTCSSAATSFIMVIYPNKKGTYAVTQKTKILLFNKGLQGQPSKAPDNAGDRLV
ncbi:hypothetical protein ACER0C_019933 [Sarotherodon galilaeus]